ncbi:helix-turn-helix domain-containing protein [Mangrovibacterium lignilyticum]|uniref:helix-turn-helix domain-containing protein n=1 Tax=Mangrovibacterium lignilyticum TaxID=2668052 RepID=UPI0013D379C7|nr:helix-turn-helix domain-containing protein [Mangrovibacterium lignilyticum]
MKDSFIHKLREIILRNLENEKFGVLDLADEIGLSRSQTLRKTKIATGRSVNQLIREIRLEEACKFINRENLTASEIAYKVGFSSPSYFNKCFLDQFGLTPGEYKKKIEGGELPDSIDLEPRVKWWRQKPIAAAVLILIIILGGYISVVIPNNEYAHEKASIAVLPFLFLSEDHDKEYLADGITEAITFELYKNSAIRVISRGSAMIYKREKKLYPQIARELNVDLLLEGSVIYGGDSMRVVVQLINPFPEEDHVWANAYDQDHSNILQLISHVSNEIAREISTIIGQPLKEVSNPEVDPEAYDLYLRGRHLWNTQKIRYASLSKALDYLNQAIEKAPDFAPAYVTLAETYLSINTLIGDNEEKLSNRENAQSAINRALQIDPNLAEAYITGGNLAGKFDWDWSKMKSLAEKGLELEPNNSNAHLSLSNYYVVKGDYENAINEALKAQNLDPVNPITGCLLAERYYIAGNYEKSINEYKEVLELNPDYGFAWNGIGFAYYQAGEREEARRSWLQLQHIMGNEAMIDCYTTDTFENCLNFWLQGAQKNAPRYCSNPVVIASVYMLLDNDSGATEYLDIAFDYKNEDLPVMLTYPDFAPLYPNPEFQELAQKIGVVIPE